EVVDEAAVEACQPAHEQAEEQRHPHRQDAYGQRHLASEHHPGEDVLAKVVRAPQEYSPGVVDAEQLEVGLPDAEDLVRLAGPVHEELDRVLDRGVLDVDALPRDGVALLPDVVDVRARQPAGLLVDPVDLSGWPEGRDRGASVLVDPVGRKEPGEEGAEVHDDEDASAHEGGLVLAELLPDDLALRLAYTLRGLARVVRVEVVEPSLRGGTRRAIVRVRHSAYPYLIRGSTAARRRSEMRLPIISKSVVITSRPRIT